MQRQGIRTFLAIQPDEAVREALAVFQSELEEAGIQARWVPAPFLHLTIKFLGNVPESELLGVQKVLQERLGDLPGPQFEVRGVGAFPNLKKARVLWAGVYGSGLEEVLDRTEAALSPLGFPPEERAFEPHVSVGRLKPKQASVLASVLKAHRDRSFGESRIGDATLYRSDLEPEGPVYTPIGVLPFAA